MGIQERVNSATKKACAARLGRIEGQVRGIARMLEDDRYCIDVITQIQAVKAALRRVEEEMLRDHVSHCVEEAIRSGDAKQQRRKVAELIQVLGRRSS
ncbi:metal-sensitive transcriptional regulator [Candidatus Binatia bacterium]|jgi:DNA-binding FrmR family transcriptional regulator|nr:metal-sensitive transcriptional regulator [Candidatus Binatia bacterium]